MLQVRLQSLLLLDAASAALVACRAPLQACIFAAAAGGAHAGCAARLAALVLGLGFLLPASIVYAAEGAARRRFLRRRCLADSKTNAAAAGAHSLGVGREGAPFLMQAASVH